MRLAPILLPLLALTLAADCPGVNTAPGSDMLRATLTASPAGPSAVSLTLAVTNTSRAPVTLTFGSSQQFDFTVRRADGASVWTWSADRSFLTVITSRTLAAGETVTYSAQWTSAPPGTYVATGSVTGSPRPADASATVTVP